MQFKVRKLSHTQAEISITNTKDEVETAYQIAFKLAQKDLRLPGFRKGKAPIQMVERHLEKTVWKDAVNELLRKNIKKCLSTAEPKAASLPEMEVLEFERKKGASFIGKYDLFPYIKLGQYKKIEIEESLFVIEEKDILTELEKIRKGKALLREREENEKIVKGDQVCLEIKITVSEPKNNTNQKTGKMVTDEIIFQHENLKVTLGNNQLLPGIDDEILNMIKEEEKNFNLDVEDEFIDKRFSGKKLSVYVKLLECHYEELPELDDELAKDLGEYENLNELKKEIENKIKEYSSQIILKKSKATILEKLVLSSEVFFSDNLLQKECEHTMHHVAQNYEQKFGKRIDRKKLLELLGKDEEEIRKDCKMNIKKQLIVTELQKIINIEVTDKECEEKWNFLYTTLPQENEEREGKPTTTPKMQDEDRERLRDMMKQKKIFTWLYENAIIKTGQKITYAELQKTELPG